MSNRKETLSGCDYFHLLLDKQMKERGLAGNISRIQFQLNPDADFVQMRQQLLHNPTLVRVTSLRISQSTFRVPTWQESDEISAPAVLIHDDMSKEAFHLNIITASLFPTSLVRIDLVTMRDGSKHAVVAMHHALFDHLGMIRFIDALQSDLPEARFFLHHQKHGLHKTWADAVKVTLHVFASAGRNLASLVSRPSSAVGTTCYQTHRFSADETAQIDQHAWNAGARYGISMYYLAATMMAVKFLFESRGQYPEIFWAPIPHDQRKKGEAGHLVGNALSFLFMRATSQQLTSLPAAVEALNACLRQQIKTQTAQRYTSLLGLLRWLPLWVVEAMMGLSTGGRGATFAFSELGLQRHPINHFVGADVKATSRFPPVPVQPGISVVFVRQQDALEITIGHLSELVSTKEVLFLMHEMKQLILPKK